MLLQLLFVVSSVAYRSISNSNFPVKMPRFCCVYSCSTTASKENCITVHLIPYFEDSRPVAKQRRKRWIDFVRKTRAKWTPSKYSGICSQHFNVGDYEQSLAMPSLLPGFSESFKRELVRDQFGISAVPSIYPARPSSSAQGQNKETVSVRGSRCHRQISTIYCFALIALKYQC